MSVTSSVCGHRDDVVLAQLLVIVAWVDVEEALTEQRFASGCR